MTDRKPADIVVAHFIARVLNKLTREQIGECLDGIWREIDSCTPDSYSLKLAQDLLHRSDLSTTAHAMATEMAAEKVEDAKRENSWDAEKFRKIQPVSESLGTIVPQLRGLRNCLTASLEALGEPLDALDPFVSKDRWG